MTDFYPFRESLRNVKPKVSNRAVWGGGIRLDRAEVPFPPSPNVVRAVADWAREGNRYPEPDCATLKRALSAYVRCEESQILVGNGSDDIIDTVVRCCLNPGDEIAIPVPTFYFYQRSAEVNGGKAVFAPTTEGFKFNADALLSRITPRTKVVFVASPNNPTGRVADLLEIERLISRCPCLVVVDECYFEFADVTLADRIGHHRNLLISRSFSKAFGLAGVRLGYAIGHERLISILHSAMQPFPVSGAAQAAGFAAINDLPYIAAEIRKLRSELQRMSTALKALGFRVYDSSTNFVLVDVRPVGRTATKLVTELRARGLYVWDCTGAPGIDDHHIRISAGSPEQTNALLEQIRALLTEYSIKPV